MNDKPDTYTPDLKGSAAAPCSAWFSYDPAGNGMMFHESEEAARAAAVKAIDEERRAACEDQWSGWSDTVTDICWGKVSQRAEQVPAPEGYEDYALQPNAKSEP